MGKLINADEAFRVLSDYYHHRTETQADALREALDRVPEAVVRCGDCKWFMAEDEMCGASGECPGPDDYCSYGERKTDEID